MLPQLPSASISGVTEYVDKYPIFAFIIAYMGGILSLVVGNFFFGPGFTIVLYFIFGILLTRFVTRRITWTPFATLENVVVSKIALVIAWPIRIPILIGKLIVARVL